MLEGYKICSYAELGDVSESVCALWKDAFAEHEGVIVASLDFVRWYLSRPGMAPSSCFAAVHDGKVVSSLFVTIQKVRLGGLALKAGIIDTVMTHREHRRRGLATRLLDEALRFMERSGVDFGMLYALPDTPQHGLYTKVGFNELVRANIFVATLGQRTESPVRLVRPEAAEDAGALIKFINDMNAGYDGFTPVDEALWRWRRVTRPPDFPAATYVVEREGAIAATATLARGALVVNGKPSHVTVMTDVAISPGVHEERPLGALLAKTPPNEPTFLLSATTNKHFNWLCANAGFKVSHQEACLVKTITNEARAAALRKPRLWYTLVESVIGV